MTFEEFFTKKKIDLARLKRAKPDLYEEFRDHYTQMGEKSFDHTKKYWFNRLRKDYLLEEVDLPPVKVKASEILPTASDTEAPSSAMPTSKPAGFTPRFKPAVTKPVTKVEKSENTSTEDKPPTEPQTPQKAATPSGFKPRFKPGITPETKKQQPEEDTEKSTASAKPLGFKPRFKAGVTEVNKVVEEPKTEAPAPEESAPQSTPPITSQENQVPTKPLGFKPRFKAGVTQTKPKAEEEVREPPEEAPKTQSTETSTDNPNEDSQARPSKPLGFKPRFKPKN